MPGQRVTREVAELYLSHQPWGRSAKPGGGYPVCCPSRAAGWVSLAVEVFRGGEARSPEYTRTRQHVAKHSPHKGKKVVSWKRFEK